MSFCILDIFGKETYVTSIGVLASKLHTSNEKTACPTAAAATVSTFLSDILAIYVCVCMGAPQRKNITFCEKYTILKHATFEAYLVCIPSV